MFYIYICLLKLILKLFSFIQVIWDDSTLLGMGRVNTKKNGMSCSYIVARYKKAGNVKGEYANNVLEGRFSSGLCKKLNYLIKHLKSVKSIAKVKYVPTKVTFAGKNVFDRNAASYISPYVEHEKGERSGASVTGANHIASQSKGKFLSDIGIIQPNSGFSEENVRVVGKNNGSNGSLVTQNEKGSISGNPDIVVNHLQSVKYTDKFKGVNFEPNTSYGGMKSNSTPYFQEKKEDTSDGLVSGTRHLPANKNPDQLEGVAGTVSPNSAFGANNVDVTAKNGSSDGNPYIAEQAGSISGDLVNVVKHLQSDKITKSNGASGTVQSISNSDGNIVDFIAKNVGSNVNPYIDAEKGGKSGAPFNGIKYLQSPKNTDKFKGVSSNIQPNSSTDQKYIGVIAKNASGNGSLYVKEGKEENSDALFNHIKHLQPHQHSKFKSVNDIFDKAENSGGNDSSTVEEIKAGMYNAVISSLKYLQSHNATNKFKGVGGTVQPNSSSTGGKHVGVIDKSTGGNGSRYVKGGKSDVLSNSIKYIQPRKITGKFKGVSGTVQPNSASGGKNAGTIVKDGGGNASPNVKEEKGALFNNPGDINNLVLVENMNSDKNNIKEGRDDASAPFDENGLQAHNIFRAIHGSTDLRIDPTLSEEAELYAKELAKLGHLKHAQLEDVGENLAYGCSSKDDYELSAAEATKRW